MAGELVTIALSVMLQVGVPQPQNGAVPPQYGTPQYGVPQNGVQQYGNNPSNAGVGTPGPSETPNYPALQNAFNHYGHEGQFEQRYPFDSQQNWVHGYFQEIPAYGGHVFFRPYNYKDVMSQSQTSAGWGMSPTMPYSQQFWHRYHDQATMLKLSRNNPNRLPTTTPELAPQQNVMPAAAYTTSAAPVTFAPQYYAPAAVPMNPAPVQFNQPGFAPAAAVTAGPFLAPQ